MEQKVEHGLEGACSRNRYWSGCVVQAHPCAVQSRRGRRDGHVQPFVRWRPQAALGSSAQTRQTATDGCCRPSSGRCPLTDEPRSPDTVNDAAFDGKIHVVVREACEAGGARVRHVALFLEPAGKRGVIGHGVTVPLATTSSGQKQRICGRAPRNGTWGRKTPSACLSWTGHSPRTGWLLPNHPVLGESPVFSDLMPTEADAAGQASATPSTSSSQASSNARSRHAL